MLLEEKPAPKEDETTKEILVSLVDNLHTTIINYQNEHGVKSFAQKVNSGENSLTPSGNTLQLPKGSIGSDFTSVTSTKNAKEEKKSSKKVI